MERRSRCLAVALAVLLSTVCEAAPPTTLTQRDPERSPGSAAALLDPVEMVRDICGFSATRRIPLQGGGGGGAIGVRYYTWKLEFDLPVRERERVRSRLIERLEDTIRRAGAAGKIVGAGGNGRFQDTKRFTYTIKGQANQRDLIGHLSVDFVPLSDARVCLIMSVQEAEIDVVSRLKADPRFRTMPDELKAAIEKWEAMPTAAEARRAYAVSLAEREPGGNWQRDPRPLLTHFDNMYNPCVVETGGEHRFRMWFFGWATGHGNPDVPGCDAIFHARSKDLRNWEVHGKGESWDATMTPAKWAPVLHASDRWYEAWHVGDPSVVFRDDRFYMAYSATSKHFGKVAGYPATMVQCIMGAVSDDGIHWRKTDAPLLIRAGDTAKPKPEPDRIGDFHRPCLRWEGGRWRLWFDYWLPGKGVCMGYAENSGDFARRGGFAINHDLAKPLLEDWPNPEVVKVGDQYHCFSDAPGYPTKPGESPWKSRQLREAVSPDGLTWHKLGFIPPDDDTDACHVPQALVTELDGRRWLYLFYATQIGTRKNDGKYHYQYDRIRAMRRPIQVVAADAPIRARLGARQTLLDDGQHGLKYFPDGRLAFIRRRPEGPRSAC